MFMYVLWLVEDARVYRTVLKQHALMSRLTLKQALFENKELNAAHKPTVLTQLFDDMPTKATVKAYFKNMLTLDITDELIGQFWHYPNRH